MRRFHGVATTWDGDEPCKHGEAKPTPQNWILGAIGMGPYQQQTP
jgi:hypothetical protein